MTIQTIASLAILGALIGIWPLILFINKNNLPFALLGFAISIVSGIAFGIIGSLAITGIFVYIAKKKINNSEEKSEVIEN